MTQITIGLATVGLVLVASLISICIAYMNFEKTYSDVQFASKGDQLILISVRMGFAVVVTLWFGLVMATLMLSMDALAIFYW